MNSTRRAAATAASIALLGAVSLSACGGDSAPNAKDAWNKTQDAMGKHTSFTVKGNGSDGPGKTLQISMSGDTKGDAYSMDMSEGSEKAKLISVDGKQYINANKGYYESKAGDSGKEMASKLADKWIINPQSDGEGSPLEGLVHDMQKDDDATSKQLLSGKATVTADSVDGTDAWKIIGPDKKTAAWISKDGKYNLLKIQGLGDDGDKDSDHLSDATFSDYDKKFDIKAPAGAKSAAAVALGG